jgi:hypothetical protein
MLPPVRGCRWWSRAPNRARGVACLLSLTLAACSSSYYPARSPRIAVVSDQGRLTLVKEGRSYDVGFFGSGVVEAVEGNPTAEERAQSYQNRMIAAWSVYGVGLGALVTGVALEPNEDHPAIPATIALAGMAGVLTGAILLVNGQAYFWDAINTYNDGVDRQLYYAPPPYYPPGFYPSGAPPNVRYGSPALPPAPAAQPPAPAPEPSAFPPAPAPAAPPPPPITPAPAPTQAPAPSPP